MSLFVVLICACIAIGVFVGWGARGDYEKLKREDEELATAEKSAEVGAERKASQLEWRKRALIARQRRAEKPRKRL